VPQRHDFGSERAASFFNICPITKKIMSGITHSSRILIIWRLRTRGMGLFATSHISKFCVSELWNLIILSRTHTSISSQQTILIENELNSLYSLFNFINRRSIRFGYHLLILPSSVSSRLSIPFAPAHLIWRQVAVLNFCGILL
jgi:hypothetical protein